MNVLKYYREQKGWTQEELADHSGVNYRIITYYEQGYRNLDGAHGKTIYKLAKALGCSMEDLITDKD